MARAHCSQLGTPDYENLLAIQGAVLLTATQPDPFWTMLPPVFKVAELATTTLGQVAEMPAPKLRAAELPLIVPLPRMPAPPLPEALLSRATPRNAIPSRPLPFAPRCMPTV